MVIRDVMLESKRPPIEVAATNIANKADIVHCSRQKETTAKVSQRNSRDGKLCKERKEGVERARRTVVLDLCLQISQLCEGVDNDTEHDIHQDSEK